eukprot:COSAG02_NODE_69216_length_199_cov_129.890000_1_plen_34_part_01
MIPTEVVWGSCQRTVENVNVASSCVSLPPPARDS